jgi:hypothetical protein
MILTVHPRELLNGIYKSKALIRIPSIQRQLKTVARHFDAGKGAFAVGLKI